MKFIVSFFVFILVIAAAWFFWVAPDGEEPVFCTQEAKLCSDGSYVGRTGPKCEFSACPGDDGDGGDFETSGIVKGKVSIGPLCPVEREGVPCGPDDVYSSRKIVMTPKGGGRPVDVPFYIQLNADGTFEERIPEGDYEVALTDCGFMGCQYELPKMVRVLADQTLSLMIDIDTGIR